MEIEVSQERSQRHTLVNYLFQEIKLPEIHEDGVFTYEEESKLEKLEIDQIS